MARPQPSEIENAAARRPAAKRLRPLRQLAPFLKPYRLMMVLAGLALIVAAGATLVLPAAVRGVIDHGFAGGETRPISAVISWR